MEKEASKDTPKPFGISLTIFVTVAIYFMGQILGSLLALIYPASKGWNGDEIVRWLEDSTIAQFITIVLIEAVSLGLLYLFLKYRRVALSKIGLIKPKFQDVLYAFAGFAAYLPIYIVTAILAANLIPTLDVEQEQQIGFTNASGSAELTLVFLALVVLVPITEEILIRGFLYSGLRSKLSVRVAAVLASFLFAIAHLQLGSGNPPLWIAAIDTFILSLVLVYLRERTSSLWPGVGLHAIKNGLAFMLLFVFAS